MRRAQAILVGLAVSAASIGLVTAQELVPPPPGGGGLPVVPGTAPEAPVSPEAAPGGPPPTVTLPMGAAPPEEAEPPATVIAEAQVQPEPAEPPEEAPKAAPLKRPRFSSAILQAVDKVTAETMRFEVKVGEPIRYKGIVMTVHACEGAASDEGFPDAFAHVDIQAQPEAVRTLARVVFRGWMFASSPALHPVEHPLYDVWLIACRTPAPASPGGAL
jgi:hypothetical protein